MRTIHRRSTAAAIAATLLGALSAAPLPAQSATPYVAVGLGAGAARESVSGPAARAALTFADRDRLLRARFAMASDFELFVSPAETAWDLGVLYGKRSEHRYGHASASAGLALVGGMRRGAYLYSSGDSCSTCFSLGTSHYEKDPFHTVGIPLELELVWTPWKAIGIGVVGFGNANPVRPFAGAALTLYAGSVRP